MTVARLSGGKTNSANKSEPTRGSNLRVTLLSAILIPLLIMVTIMTIVGCGGTGGTQAEERSPGQVAFERNCQTCHRLPSAMTHSDEEWPELVSRYGERARISKETVSIIVSYLQKNNQD